MIVSFYATLRAIIGKKTIEIDLTPGATAQDVLDMVVAKAPALREQLIDKNNALQRHIKFFINGREVVYLPEQMNTKICPEDKLDIFPPVGGG